MMDERTGRCGVARRRALRGLAGRAQHAVVQLGDADGAVQAAAAALGRLEDRHGPRLARRDVDRGDLLGIQAELLRIASLDLAAGDLARRADADRLLQHARVGDLHEAHHDGAGDGDHRPRPVPVVHVVDDGLRHESRVHAVVPHRVEADGQQALGDVLGLHVQRELAVQHGRRYGDLEGVAVEVLECPRRRREHAARAGGEAGAAVDAQLPLHHRLALLHADRLGGADAHAGEAAVAARRVHGEAVRVLNHRRPI